MIVATLLALAQATATPASASPPATSGPINPERADARCLAAFGVLADDPKPEVQRASQMGALFFYGKLLGRNPRVDLRAAMLDASTMTASQAKTELDRCGVELERSGEAMQAAGAALEEKAKAAPAPTPARRPTATPIPRR